ncbi:hypothetical protein DDB_G0286771 [Dictyostelium discoideum AX4]|uniref:Uncharacterized protein n=1 Tax=Dictyostelium discoideum TaxID=44689 RepID=Q54L91_DICDI|nr:hypothetical protein DDB_G0286771 [Dictyostelium discoideum AX4]EAL64141.1 hypothetical protein DDB_G0286771 [Dictyostelium discoideum AX4]|eukprot:XP_637670.1 hypothetical protein DDB_G0286771 [Dictyostelium discoideum AX4]
MNYQTENIIDFECINKMRLNWNIYKEEEIMEVMNMLESKNNLKLLSIQENYSSTTKVSSVLGDSDIGRQISFFDHINSFSQNAIKSHIPGD